MGVLRELALFAGAGGGLLGSRLLGWRPVCAVEHNPYRQAVLLARQADGVLDPFPIWSDVGDFDGRPWRGKVDIVSAGFPCQPFSVAGKRKAAGDERNGWPDTIRTIRAVGPGYAWLENVQGLLTAAEWRAVVAWHTIERTLFGRIRQRHTATFRPPGYFGVILGDLAEAGFDAEWCVLGADDVGANHRRKRLWMLAYAAGNGRKGRNVPIFQRRSQQADGDAVRASARDVPDAARNAGRAGLRAGESAGERGRHSGDGGSAGEISDAPRRGRTVCGSASGQAGQFAQLHEDVSDAEQDGRDGAGETERGLLESEGHDHWWAAEPDVGRVADGVAHRVDRLAAIGDGQVPAVVRAAGILLGAGI